MARRRLELRITVAAAAALGVALSIPALADGDGLTAVGDVVLGALGGTFVAVVDGWRIGRRLDATVEAPPDASVETPEGTRRRELLYSAGLVLFVGLVSLGFWPDTGVVAGFLAGLAAAEGAVLRRIGAWERASGAVSSASGG
jgi:hypothetical protein